MKLSNIRWLNKKDIIELVELWEEQYGIDHKKALDIILGYKKKEHLHNNQSYDNNYLLFKTSKNRIYMIRSSVSRHIEHLHSYNINSLGLYIGELYEPKKDSNTNHVTNHKFFRFSIDGLFIFGNLVKKNFLIIDEEDIKQWCAGYDLSLKKYEHSIVGFDNTTKFIIIAARNRYTGLDFFGCAKLSIDKAKLLNYMPKSRRIIKNIQ